MKPTDRYWLSSEPRGQQYERFVEEAARHSMWMSLVERDTEQFVSVWADQLSRLKSDLTAVTKQSEWPGTKLLGGDTAQVFWYKISPVLIGTIKSAVNKLYDWVRPNLPEDLAFYREDKSVFLGTSAHERFAFLNLSAPELFALKQAVPEIEFFRKPPPHCL
jgi:hypothetical protein